MVCERAPFDLLGGVLPPQAEHAERGSFADHVQSLDARWRGLSVAAPLKEEAHQYARELDDDARLTGSSTPCCWRGFNTDVDSSPARVGHRRVTTVLKPPSLPDFVQLRIAVRSTSSFKPRHADSSC